MACLQNDILGTVMTTQLEKIIEWLALYVLYIHLPSSTSKENDQVLDFSLWRICTMRPNLP